MLQVLRYSHLHHLLRFFWVSSCTKVEGWVPRWLRQTKPNPPELSTAQATSMALDFRHYPCPTGGALSDDETEGTSTEPWLTAQGEFRCACTWYPGPQRTPEYGPPGGAPGAVSRAAGGRLRAAARPGSESGAAGPELGQVRFVCYQHSAEVQVPRTMRAAKRRPLRVEEEQNEGAQMSSDPARTSKPKARFHWHRPLSGPLCRY